MILGIRNSMKTVAYNFGKGFSLIELVITCAIVAVIASVALPSFLEQVRITKRSDAKKAVLDCAARQFQRFTTTNQFSEDGVCPAESVQGFYSLSVTVGGNPNGSTFQINASAQGEQSGDTQCAVFILTSTGFEGSIPADNADECWQ